MALTSEIKPFSPAPVGLTARFSSRDFVFNFLNRRLHLTTAWMAALVAIIGLFLQRGLPLLLKDPFSNQTLFSALIESCVILPLLVVIYLRFPDWLAQLFDSLKQNGLIETDTSVETEQFEQFINEVVNAIDSPIASAVGITAVILYSVLRFLGLFHFILLSDTFNNIAHIPDAWYTPYLTLLLIFYALPIYGAVVTIYRLLAALYYSGILFQKFSLNINPFHLDGSGGLDRVGTLLVGSVLVTTLLGLAAVGNSIAVHYPYAAVDFSRPEFLVPGLVYAVLTPLLLFNWLWRPHQAMVKARDRILQPLAEDYHRVVSKPSQTAETDINVIKERTEHLVEIKHQYDFIMDAFPVWPLPIRSLKQLITTASLPSISSIMIVLFPTLPEKLVKLLDLFH